MATDIVQLLFGVTPESYQRQQDALLDKQALQFAEMDPLQRATYGIYRGAGQLGGAIGRALGGEDPELARISLRQQVAREIDPTSLESIQAGIQKLAPQDPQGAMMLTQELRKAQESGALVGQREASAAASLAQAGRERQQAIPADILKSREIARLSAQRNALLAMGDDQSADQAALLKTQIDELRSLKEVQGSLVDASGNVVYQGTPKGESFGAEAERVSRELYGKPFSGLTQTQMAAVNKRVEETGKAKAKAGAAILGGPGKLAEIAQYTSNLQATMKAPLETVDRVDNALGSINDAIITGNFASYNAARTQFAKAVAGAGDLSQRELKAAGADPSLLGGGADYLSTLATSTPTADTMKKMRSAMEVLRKVNVNKATSELERQKKIAVDLGYPAETINAALQFPQLTTTPSAGGAAGGDLAAQAAAELARRRQGAK